MSDSFFAFFEQASEPAYAAHTVKIQKPKKQKSWPMMLVALIVVGLLAFSGWRLFVAEPATVSAPEPAVTFSSSDPDTYAGATEGPGLEAIIGPAVALPSVNVLSALTQTDAKNGDLIIPEPPDATWYKQSAELGSKAGTSVLAGHVNFGFDQAAPFHELHRVEKGAPVYVRDFKGNEREYKVSAVNLYPWSALPENLFDTSNQSRIVLVTCSGPVQGEGNYKTFMYNLVVEAVPVN